ncbi:MAG: ribosome maturation factor RimM [Clostridiales bacterium]|nr:ribosome maturation factor RimM [Clostridiales bacterium]
MRTEYLRIGEIVRPQGIRGELKLRQESQDPTRYERLTRVWLKSGAGYKEFEVKKGRASGDFAYLTLAGIDSRDAAEALRGQAVYVDRAHAIALPEGEFFIADLIGMRAETEDGSPVGRLKEVIQNHPACDVYVFDTERGEMMMPALRRVILSTDPESGIMRLSRDGLQEVAVWQDTPPIRED